MRIGVVSDTHGHVEFALAAVRMLQSLDVAEVLHCGDIGSPEIVMLFRSWPTHFVFGNVDYDVGTLRKAIRTAGQAYVVLLRNPRAPRNPRPCITRRRL